jgi:hypothetical protein
MASRSLKSMWAMVLLMRVDRLAHRHGVILKWPGAARRRRCPHWWAHHHNGTGNRRPVGTDQAAKVRLPITENDPLAITVDFRHDFPHRPKATFR